MTVIILIAVIVILAIWIVSLYNSLVKLRNNRENAFADIDVQLKQRHDLVVDRFGADRSVTGVNDAFQGLFLV